MIENNQENFLTFKKLRATFQAAIQLKRQVLIGRLKFCSLIIHVF